MVQQPLAGSVILLLEDEPIILWSVEQALNEAGAKVLPACTIEAARKISRGEWLSAAVLDYLVHGQDCRALIEDLRSVAIPVLLVSGLDPEDLPVGTDVLAKPFNSGQLVGAISRLRLPQPE